MLDKNRKLYQIQTTLTYVKSATGGKLATKINKFSSRNCFSNGKKKLNFNFQPFRKESTKINFEVQPANVQPAKNGFRFLNLFLCKLGLFNFLILIYFSWKHDIIFKAPGWFAIFKDIHWFYIFFGFLVLRMILVLFIHLFTEYIQTFSKNKNSLYTLAILNLLTLPIHLPLIGTWIAYQKGNEFLFNNWFFGTFRRLLSSHERHLLFQQTVNNFLEGVQTSKEIHDSLKNFAYKNYWSIIDQFDHGSPFATQFISDQLQIQLEELQMAGQQFLLATAEVPDFSLPFGVDSVTFYNPIVTILIILMGTFYLFILSLFKYAYYDPKPTTRENKPLLEIDNGVLFPPKESFESNLLLTSSTFFVFYIIFSLINKFFKKYKNTKR